MKKDIKEALKEAHDEADVIIGFEETAERIRRCKKKFKIWANKPWKTISKGEALIGAAIIILMILAAS
jgi:ribosomal protein L30E